LHLREKAHISESGRGSESKSKSEHDRSGQAGVRDQVCVSESGSENARSSEAREADRERKKTKETQIYVKRERECETGKRRVGNSRGGERGRMKNERKCTLE